MIIGALREESNSRTFVLIHGAFAGGWCWRRVSDLLEENGHKVFSPTLTGLGERSHLLNKHTDLDTHVTDIVNVFKWEDLNDVTLVAHSYGGWPCSGALEQIGDRVSSIVWVDASKPENAQKVIDFTIDAVRKGLLNSVEKGEMSFPAPKAERFLLNENDLALADQKLTPQPIGTYLQPIRLSGARERVAKKTYIRATRFPNPAFDQALAECRADQSWSTIETATPGHIVMLDAPEWLADILMNAARN